MTNLAKKEMNKNKKHPVKSHPTTLCTFCPEFRGTSNYVRMTDLFKEKMERLGRL